MNRNRKKISKRIHPLGFLAAALVICVCGNTALGAIVPVYWVNNDDATWTHTGGGTYTVPTSAEDYDHEIWERPVKDNEWSDSGGVRTSEKMYFAYGDLKAGFWGVGTNADDGEDYLFVKWEVVGDWQHEVGKDSEYIGLKSHYYFYAEPANGLGFVVEVNDASDVGADFDDPKSAGKVNTCTEDSDGDVPGTGITVTEEGGDSFGDSQVAGEVRANYTTNIVEVAVLLDDLGLVLSDFDTDLDYAYTGVAVSNPSSPNSDLFANDFYPEAIGSGVEYDTMDTLPEPTTAALLGAGALGLLLRRYRRRRVK